MMFKVKMINLAVQVWIGQNLIGQGEFQLGVVNIQFNDNQIVLGKLSGRNAFRTRLKELGFELSETELNEIREKVNSGYYFSDKVVEKIAERLIELPNYLDKVEDNPKEDNSDNDQEQLNA